METTTFTALCERAGRWWTIRVPQVEGLTGQVRSIDQAEIMTRQLISRTLGIPAESIKVEVIPDAPMPVAQALAARHAARQAAQVASQATKEALMAMSQEGYSFQDAATMLGLSATEIEKYGPRPRAADSPAATDPVEPGPLLPAGN